MRTRLHLCTPEDAERLLPLVAAFHAEEGIGSSEDQREAGVIPLLEGTPHGAAYLIGPRQAPVGYVVLSFGWSVEFGGIDGFVDEFYIRPGVRGRGMGSEALAALLASLKNSQIKALHLEVDRDSPVAALYERLGFAPNSSPRMPSSGRCASISARIAVSDARSAAVTGSKWAALLSATSPAVRKYLSVSTRAASATAPATAQRLSISRSCLTLSTPPSPLPLGSGAGVGRSSSGRIDAAVRPRR